MPTSISSRGIADSLFSQDKLDFIRKKGTQFAQVKLDGATEKVDLLNGRVAALTQLASRVTAIRKEATNISLSSFNSKTSSVTSSDGLAGNTYFDVTGTGTNSTVGNINVVVNSVATYANCDIIKNGGGGFLLTDALGAGNLAITITNGATLGGTAPNVNVAVSVTDTINDLLANCNRALDQYNVVATLGKTGSNYYLKLKSTVTGNRQITITNFPGNTAQGARANGVDARITVDNQLLDFQASNQFNDIEQGVSISVKQPSGATNQTITIVEDKEEALNSIVSLLDSFNSYFEFIAKQTQRDPITHLAVEGAYLCNDTAAMDSEMLVENMISRLSGIIDGNISSLADIGIKLEMVPATSDAPKMQKFTIADKEALKSALYGNFAQVKTLFNDTFSFTPDIGNAAGGSYLTGTIQKSLNNGIVGQNLSIEVQSQAGVIQAVAFSTDSWVTSQPAQFNGTTLIFDGTVLEGLQLNFFLNSVNDAGGVHEFFTLNVTEGLADNVNRTAINLYDFGTGEINLAIETAKADAEAASFQLKKAQDAFDKKQAKFDMIESRINAITMKSKIQLATINAYLGKDNN